MTTRHSCHICGDTAKFYEEGTRKLFCNAICQRIEDEYGGVEMYDDALKLIMMEMDYITLLRFAESSEQAMKILNEDKSFIRNYFADKRMRHLVEEILEGAESDWVRIYGVDTPFKNLVRPPLIFTITHSVMWNQYDGKFMNYVVSHASDPSGLVSWYDNVSNDWSRTFEIIVDGKLVISYFGRDVSISIVKKLSWPNLAKFVKFSKNQVILSEARERLRKISLDEFLKRFHNDREHGDAYVELLKFKKFEFTWLRWLTKPLHFELHKYVKVPLDVKLFVENLYLAVENGNPLLIDAVGYFLENYDARSPKSQELYKIITYITMNSKSSQKDKYVLIQAVLLKWPIYNWGNFFESFKKEGGTSADWDKHIASFDPRSVTKKFFNLNTEYVHS